MQLGTIIVPEAVAFPWLPVGVALIMVAITAATLLGTRRAAKTASMRAARVSFVISLTASTVTAATYIESYTAAPKHTVAQWQIFELEHQLGAQTLSYVDGSDGVTGDIQARCGSVYCTLRLKQAENDLHSYGVILTQTSHQPLLLQV